MEEIDINALLIGSKSENGELFKSLLSHLIDEHLGWRQNYMPQDPPLISPTEQASPAFQQTVQRLKTVMEELSARMRKGSVPWESARYWGHMNSETLIPALLGYYFGMLWNENNVSYEGSPATSFLEEEVGRDFAKLFSFPNGWGHICADGSIANLEALWYARNVKSLPLAMKEVKPELVAGKSDWELLNMPIEKIIDLMSSLSEVDLDLVKRKSARSGKRIEDLGKWIIPATKHYSWLKAADITGVGMDQVIMIPVDDHYRMKIDVLEKTIEDLGAQKIPVLGVVGVVGTTEEGAIDHIDKICALRKNFAKKGINFYLHADCAYGGYARSIILDSNYDVIPYADLEHELRENEVFQDLSNTISKDDYESLKALSEVDSITVDPHKMGYVPYTAGGIVIRDERMRNAISYFASYVFDKTIDPPVQIGPYILEGSKAGAAAAAVWAAHRVLPLNITGYGKIIGRSMEGARNFYKFMSELEVEVEGKKIKSHTVYYPDFNMVDWVFNVEGNTDLKAMNELNQNFFIQSSIYSGMPYLKPILTSHTDFAKGEYGDSCLDFIRKIGITSPWDASSHLTTLRASAMNLMMYDAQSFASYEVKLKEAIEEVLKPCLKDEK